MAPFDACLKKQAETGGINKLLSIRRKTGTKSLHSRSVKWPRNNQVLRFLNFPNWSAS